MRIIRAIIVIAVFFSVAYPVFAVDPAAQNDSPLIADSFKISAYFLNAYCDSSTIIREENRILSEHGPFVPTDSWNYNLRRYGISLDYSPQLIHFFSSQSNLSEKAFCGCGTFTGGINLGLKLNLEYTTVDQEITSLLNRDNKYRGRVLEFSTLSTGPYIDIILGNANSDIYFLLHSYFLFGYVVDGKLTAAPGLRDAGEPMSSSYYSTDVTGYAMRFAFGPHLVINHKWFPVFIGLNAILYSRTRLILKNDLPAYNNSIDSISFREYEQELWELVIGVHF